MGSGNYASPCSKSLQRSDVIMWAIISTDVFDRIDCYSDAVCRFYQKPHLRLDKKNTLQLASSNELAKKTSETPISLMVTPVSFNALARVDPGELRYKIWLEKKLDFWFMKTACSYVRLSSDITGLWQTNTQPNARCTSSSAVVARKIVVCVYVDVVVCRKNLRASQRLVIDIQGL